MNSIFAKYLFRIYLILLFIKNLPNESIEEIYLVRILQFTGLILFIIIIKSQHFHHNLPPFVRKNVQYLVILSIVGSLLAGLYQMRLGNVLVAVNVVGFIGFGLYFVYWKNSKEMTWFLNCLTAYTFFQITDGVHVKQLFRGSYNHVSTIFLFGVIGFYAERLNKKDEALSYIPVIIAVYISLITTGRSGILSSLLLLVIVLVYNLGKSITGFLSSCFILLLLAINSQYLIDYAFGYLDKFMVQGFTEVGRELILNFALSNMTVGNTLFGIDYYELLYRYDLTIHNSFLSIHSRFGIVGFFAFIMLPVFIYFKDKRASSIWLFLTSVLYLRSFTDSILIADGYLFGSLFFVLVYGGLHRIYSSNE